MITFAEDCRRLQAYIQHRGIPVATADLPDPWLADLDGAAIYIGRGVTAEQRLFLVAHLFGHTVQWNTRAGAFALGRLRTPPVAASLLPAILEYEREAARYALGALAQARIAGAGQWLSDYSACDTAYLEHYYRTGEKREFRSFWRPGTPRLKPLPVPRFTPVRRARRMPRRMQGIVI
jgi:hypothetical protein